MTLIHLRQRRGLLTPAAGAGYQYLHTRRQPLPTCTPTATATPTVTLTPTPDTRPSQCANSTAVPYPDSHSLVTDCKTLLKAKPILEGSGSGGLNWSTRHHISEWTGVQVYSYHVTKLDIQYRGLTGKIPTALGNLPQLDYLVMSNNQLTGSIPAAMGNLTQLKTLALGHNRLTGNIPPELGNLANLQSLTLNNNQLTGSIPKELGNLTKLRRLYIDFDN